MAYNRNKSLTKAQKLLQKGKVADAIKEYQEVVDNDPADVRTLLKVGDLQAKVGNIEAANDTYHKVAEHYAKDGFFLKAVAVFKQILKLDPGLISVYLRLAELYQQLGLTSEAMKQYQVVVKHYESQGLKKESLDVLRKMAELDPENTASKVKLAELYAKEGHREAATDQLKSIVTDLRKKENFQELTRVYEKMETLGVADSSAKLELSEIYLRTADPKKALGKLQELFAQEPKNPQILELLARCFADLQQVEKAKSVYTELTNLFTEKNQPAERDRIVAKMRTLGITVAAQPVVTGVPNVSSKAAAPVISSPAPAAPIPAVKPPSVTPPAAGSPASAEARAKLLQECEVFLKYGLVDKACQTLSKAVMTDPQDEAIRKKLVESFTEKGDLSACVQILNAACGEAQSRNLGALVVSAIQSEMAALSSGADVAVPMAEAELVVEEAVALEDTSGLEAVAIVEDEVIEESVVVEEAPVVEEQALVEEISVDEVLVIDDAPSVAPEAGSSDDIFIVDDVPAAPALETKAAPPSISPPLSVAPESPLSIGAELDAELGDMIGDSFERPEAEAQAPLPESLDAPSSDIVAEDLSFDLGSSFDVPLEAPAPEIVVLADEPLEAPEEKPVVVMEEPVFEEPIAESPVVVEEVSVEEHEPVAAEGSSDGDIFTMELEEAEYFVGKGLVDEAAGVYEAILVQDPEHPIAKAKLAEIQGVKPAKITVLRSDGQTERRQEVRVKREVIEEEPLRKGKPTATMRVLDEKSGSEAGKEGFFDLSSELEEEISDLESSLTKARDPDEEEFLSPEEVISEFKKGVARTVARDDYATHYNLGIAYKEMGLLNEAIHEFEVAAEEPKVAMDAASMIGLCLCGKREFEAAIDVYRKALARVSPTSAEALGLSYELAEAYIGHGSLGDAYKLFARIRDADPTFRDVRRRAKELEADLGSAAPAVSAPEKRQAKKEAVEIPGKKNKISYI